MVTSADKRKSFYEDVVQIGDMKDTGVGTVDAETAKAVLNEYMNGFEQRIYAYRREGITCVAGGKGKDKRTAVL